MAEVLFVVNQSYLGYTPSRVFSMLKLRKRINIQMSVSAHVTLPCFSVDGLASTESRLYFEEDGMQIDHSVGQELC